MTDVYGIFGWPVAHSVSPAMHNAAFGTLGIDAIYVPFAVPPDRLEDAVRGISALGISGINVTLPHKESIAGLLDEIDEEARTIGAVNTVVREGDRLLGYNTDAPGLVRSLEEAGCSLEGRRVVVLGAGGAARAAVVGLAKARAAKVVVAARRMQRAEHLAKSVSPGLAPCTIAAAPLSEAALSQLFAGSDIVIQATSATLAGGPGAQAFADSLPLSALPEDAVVVDLVYEPRRTTVLAQASALGLSTVEGLGMLLHQGAIAFEKWTRRRAPLDTMRQCLSIR